MSMSTVGPPRARVLISTSPKTCLSRPVFDRPFHVTEEVIDSPGVNVCETKNSGWGPAFVVQTVWPLLDALKPLMLGPSKTVMSCWLELVSVKIMTTG